MDGQETRIESIKDLEPGTHACCIYDTDRQRVELLGSYFRAGMAENDKIVFGGDADVFAAAIRHLEELGLKPGQYLRRGQISSAQQDVLFGTDSGFSPGLVKAYLNENSSTAESEGYRAFRLACEMNWSRKDLGRAEAITEYEVEINRFIPGCRCLLLGLYDSRRYDPGVLISVLSTHPVAIIGTDAFANFYYIPPEEYLDEDKRTETIYRQWTNTLRSYNETLRELEENRRKLNGVFESSLEGVVITESDGRYVYANPSAARMLGYESPDEIIGNFASYHYASKGLRDELIAELKEHGSLNNYETVVRKTDGSTFPVRLSATFTRDTAGEVETVTTFFRDVTELKVEEELELLRALSAHVLADRERERKELARDIHDHFGQTLSCMKIDLNWLLKRVGEQDLEVTEKLLDISSMTEESFGKVHELVEKLRPVALDRLGLGAALEWLLEDLRNHFNIEFSIEGDLDVLEIDKDAETQVFRIIQESLTNVGRHSGASRVSLSVENTDNDFVLKVEDNGAGISITESRSDASIGIAGMRERARNIGGQLIVEGEEGKGTVVTLLVPSPSPTRKSELGETGG